MPRPTRRRSRSIPQLQNFIARRKSLMLHSIAVKQCIHAPASCARALGGRNRDEVEAAVEFLARTSIVALARDERRQRTMPHAEAVATPRRSCAKWSYEDARIDVSRIVTRSRYLEHGQEPTLYTRSNVAYAARRRRMELPPNDGS